MVKSHPPNDPRPPCIPCMLICHTYMFTCLRHILYVMNQRGSLHEPGMSGQRPFMLCRAQRAHGIKGLLYKSEVFVPM